MQFLSYAFPFSALKFWLGQWTASLPSVLWRCWLGGRKGIRPVKNWVVGWWGAGVVICLERDADLHMAQLMPLPLTVSCFSEIQIGYRPTRVVLDKGPLNGCVCVNGQHLSAAETFKSSFEIQVCKRSCSRKVGWLNKHKVFLYIVFC